MGRLCVLCENIAREFIKKFCIFFAYIRKVYIGVMLILRFEKICNLIVCFV